MKDCLLIVDVQKDFCPGGALAASKGDEIIPAINDLIERFSLIAASKDWHPAQTIHFENWVVHCVRATSGAAFHDGLNKQKINEVFLKGTGNTDDGYSAFEATNNDLEFWLKKNGVTTIYLCGIATEYCVQSTALDARKFGLKVKLITDATAPIEAKEGDTVRSLQLMKDAGIELITHQEVLAEGNCFYV